MKEGRFYVKVCSDLKITGNVFMLYGREKINQKTEVIKIGEVKAILIDRVIFEKIHEFLTEKSDYITSCFKEIPFEEARKRIDNTQALLSKDIFRR
jgi:hypothetical protein